jgi:hypothetical protein
VIEVTPGIGHRTRELLIESGSGEHESVVYWVAPLTSNRVSRVVHPLHRGGLSGYEVDGAWLNQFFLDLAAEKDRIVAQIHSHPGARVEHSTIDDEFVVVPSVGLISLVVPFFGNGAVPVGWGVWALRADGRWEDAQEAVVWTAR